MEPMYLQVLQKETGRQIKKLLVENGYTVKDVQNAMGFENPQAVYKWISGRSLPSLDNFVILSRLLHTSIEDIHHDIDNWEMDMSKDLLDELKDLEKKCRSVNQRMKKDIARNS